MKIGIITYDRPHRKTQDLMLRLMGRKVIVITIPFKERKRHEPLYQHRPQMDTGIDTRKLSIKLGFEFIYTDDPVEISDLCDVTLIGGCGIIKTGKTPIINAHPGYLPYSRGLDALKWAIYNGHPIGVTTHVIDSEPDAGYLIEQEFVQIQPYDDFYTVAMRQYQMEIDMLIRAISLPVRDRIECGPLPVNKRMPIRLEPIMMERFLRLKQ
jgi:hypothetical protein